MLPPYLVIGLYDCSHANVRPAGIAFCFRPASSNTCPGYIASRRGQGCRRIPPRGTAQPGPNDVEAARHKRSIENNDDRCRESQHILSQACQYLDSTINVRMGVSRGAQIQGDLTADVMSCELDSWM